MRGGGGVRLVSGCVEEREDSFVDDGWGLGGGAGAVGGEFGARCAGVGAAALRGGGRLNG